MYDVSSQHLNWESSLHTIVNRSSFPQKYRLHQIMLSLISKSNSFLFCCPLLHSILFFTINHWITFLNTTGVADSNSLTNLNLISFYLWGNSSNYSVALPSYYRANILCHHIPPGPLASLSIFASNSNSLLNMGNKLSLSFLPYSSTKNEITFLPIFQLYVRVIGN